MRGNVSNCMSGDWGVDCFLKAKSTKMRPGLLKYMITVFDPDPEVFNIGGEEVTLYAPDIEAISGLQNRGHYFSSLKIDRTKEIPSNFVNPQKKKIVIDELITYIELPGSDDEDFIRRVVLVLLGTVLVPVSSKHILRGYYAFVEDVSQLNGVNCISLALPFLMSNLIKTKKGEAKNRWPKGYLALLQYLYWEKMRPKSGSSSYYCSIYRLMANWDEKTACKRDEYDLHNGCGHGRIVHAITEHHETHNDNGADDNTNKNNTSKDQNDNENTTRTTKPRVDRSSKQILEVLHDMQMKISIMQKHVALIPSLMKCVEALMWTICVEIYGTLGWHKTQD